MKFTPAPSVLQGSRPAQPLQEAPAAHHKLLITNNPNQQVSTTPFKLVDTKMKVGNAKPSRSPTMTKLHNNERESQTNGDTMWNSSSRSRSVLPQTQHTRLKGATSEQLTLYGQRKAKSRRKAWYVDYELKIIKGTCSKRDFQNQSSQTQTETSKILEKHLLKSTNKKKNHKNSNISCQAVNIGLNAHQAEYITQNNPQKTNHLCSYMLREGSLGNLELQQQKKFKE